MHPIFGVFQYACTPLRLVSALRVALAVRQTQALAVPVAGSDSESPGGDSESRSFKLALAQPESDTAGSAGEHSTRRAGPPRPGRVNDTTGTGTSMAVTQLTQAASGTAAVAARPRPRDSSSGNCSGWGTLVPTRITLHYFKLYV